MEREAEKAFLKVHEDLIKTLRLVHDDEPSSILVQDLMDEFERKFPPYYLDEKEKELLADHPKKAIKHLQERLDISEELAWYSIWCFEELGDKTT